jgi:copper resistance protein C
MFKNPLRLGLSSLFAGAVLMIADQAAAHAHLVASNPAANATITATKVIGLDFSEALEPKFSGAELVSGDGKPIAVSVLTQAKHIEVTATAPLAVGAYRLSWHVVSRDGHRTKGEFGFTVR